MTSKISFFKCMKENMRHRLAINVVTLLYFLFTLLYFVVMIQNAMAYDGWTRQEVYGSILSSAGPNELLFLCAALGAVTAFCGFSYLHSRTKTDFYHSLPVRRRDLFWTVTANSFLVFAVLLLAASVVEAVIAAVLGYVTLELLGYLFLAVLCNMLAFGSAFFTAALAMIMTGHIVVGILGTAVFITWAPMIIKYMFIELQQIFFASYVEPSEVFKLFDYGSPVYLSVCLCPTQEGWQWEDKGPVLLAVVIWLVVLAALCQFLFDRRPSEAAGKSMAFPKINPLIRVLLVIPAAVYTGSYLYSITLGASRLWVFLGAILGTILFHGIIECIYQFDIRGMWSHKKQMALTLAAVLCLTLSFYLDVYGYDRFIPAAGGVESVAVKDDVATMREIYYWGKEEKGVTGEQKEKLLTLLKTALQENAGDSTAEESGTFSGFYDTTTGRSIFEEGKKSIQVIYYMKNGREIKRNFALAEDQADAMMEKAYAMKDQRASVYSLYTADWDAISDISCNDMLEDQPLRLTEEERDQFLTTYLSELDTLTYDDMRNVIPTAELTLNHEDKKIHGYMEDYYYIYPSFTKTIAFLQGKGYDITKTLADVNITGVEIARYDADGEKHWTVTDPAVIQPVKEKLILNESNFSFYATGYEGEAAASDYDLIVYFNDGYGEKSVYAWADDETIKMLTAEE